MVSRVGTGGFSEVYQGGIVVCGCINSLFGSVYVAGRYLEAEDLSETPTYICTPRLLMSFTAGFVGGTISAVAWPITTPAGLFHILRWKRESDVYERAKRKRYIAKVVRQPHNYYEKKKSLVDEAFMNTIIPHIYHTLWHFMDY